MLSLHIVNLVMAQSIYFLFCLSSLTYCCRSCNVCSICVSSAMLILYAQYWPGYDAFVEYMYIVAYNPHDRNTKSFINIIGELNLLHCLINNVAYKSVDMQLV